MSNYIPKRVSLLEVTLSGETWKCIEGLNGSYEISSLGRIYSNVCERLLSLKPHKRYGYVYLPLGEKGKRISFRVHRLVAQAFVPNPENKKEVNHINKDKSDNRVENLEWVTGWENAKHKYGIKNWHSGQGRINPYE